MNASTLSLLVRAAAPAPGGGSFVDAGRGRDDFGTRVLEALEISLEVTAVDVERIPADGPLLVVANHPSGAVDGVLMLSLLRRVRGDVKLLGNDLLRLIPGLAPSLLPVDVFGRTGSIRRNASALRAARRWLDQGHCLVVFPAGEVAHALGSNGQTLDSPWRTSAAQLASWTGAAILPVHVSGGTSRLFRAAGRVHPLLRTLLLPTEMLSKRRSVIGVRVGRPLPASALTGLETPRHRTTVLRAAVDALGARALGPQPGCLSTRAPVAGRGPAALIEDNIQTLQPHVLLEHERYQVFCSPAAALPALLPEIGRLREIAFRDAGEGTGLPRDLDRFDETYEHLFVWDRHGREVAGAYRLGATDVVAAGGRVEGLYTRTLFDYDARLLAQIGPAIELGRSFVPPAYQRDFSPLLLLWKGISRRVVRSRRYRRLFGVVSISDDYGTLSRLLLLKFLQTSRFNADLGRLVRAKHPPPPVCSDALDSLTVSSLEEVSALIRHLESDGRDMPVLLRQYLKLSATLLGFTVDPAFGDVLDGLVLVDLARVEPAILSRYMGREDARTFLDLHRASGCSRACGGSQT